MKKFLVGVAVGSIGTFGMLLVEAEKRHGSLKRITAKALRMYADKLDPKWEHDYVEYEKYSGNTGNIGNEYRFVEFDSHEDAAQVLEKAGNILKDQGLLTVSDYVQVLGLHPSAASYGYGWVDLYSAYIFYWTRKGQKVWSIHMPEPVHIEHVN